MQIRLAIVSAAAAMVTLAGGIYWFGGSRVVSEVTLGEYPHSVSVKIPDLPSRAKEGRKLFDTNCASCHGKNASGGENGPPLVHRIYEPGHHADGTFYFAAQYGVRAHHWRFGNMPPVPNVKREDLSKIILYVRELQRANGIY